MKAILKTSHTPGPWNVELNMDDGLLEVWTREQAICCGIKFKGDAQLIASAPDLLAQLASMTDAYAKAMKDAGVTHYPEALAIVRDARAAIAKFS